MQINLMLKYLAFVPIIFINLIHPFFSNLFT